jgi:ABC-2 type transport system ATP-binding protein
MSTPIQPLVISNLSRSFGARQALNGASFELHAGEVLALLGPNGAGKTTLIRCIAGRLNVDSGSIAIQGLDVTNAGTSRPQLGIIPQELAIFARLTARENLRLFGRIAGVDNGKLTERTEWALKWTGLEDRAGEPVERFSGGMKRRLNIACGIMHKPGIVLLDEPTVGVDPQSRHRIWEMLNELKTAGASILLTTHQLDEAQTVSDRIVIIDQGTTIASGTFDQLLDQSIGRQKRIVFTLNSPIAEVPDKFEVINDLVLACGSDNIMTDLEPCLEMLRVAQADVADINIEQPSLQAVFLHLTGRALRESDAA